MTHWPWADDSCRDGTKSDPHSQLLYSSAQGPTYYFYFKSAFDLRHRAGQFRLIVYQVPGSLGPNLGPLLVGIRAIVVILRRKLADKKWPGPNCSSLDLFALGSYEIKIVCL